MTAMEVLARGARPLCETIRRRWTSAFRLLGQTTRRIWRAYWRRRARRIIALLRLSMPHLKLPIANLAANVEPSATPRNAGRIGHLSAAEARRFCRDMAPGLDRQQRRAAGQLLRRGRLLPRSGNPCRREGQAILVGVFQEAPGLQSRLGMVADRRHSPGERLPEQVARQNSCRLHHARNRWRMFRPARQRGKNPSQRSVF